MLKKEARKITGGLSKPSKMPGPAHNLPAVACKTGAKLVKVPGSVCAGCYALKGRYRFKNVQDALSRRLQALQDPRWVDAMVTLIQGQEFFRNCASRVGIQCWVPLVRLHTRNIFSKCLRLWMSPLSCHLNQSWSLISVTIASTQRGSFRACSLRCNASWTLRNL